MKTHKEWVTQDIPLLILTCKTFSTVLLTFYPIYYSNTFTCPRVQRSQMIHQESCNQTPYPMYHHHHVNTPDSLAHSNVGYDKCKHVSLLAIFFTTGYSPVKHKVMLLYINIHTHIWLLCCINVAPE